MYSRKMVTGGESMVCFETQSYDNIWLFIRKAGLNAAVSRIRR